MKIALVSTYVLYVHGGGRNIIDWLEVMLRQAGHQVEKIYLPQVDTPDLLATQMMALRWVDLDSADRVICFRPQAHLIRHRHKIIWFIHHIRAFYDLWGTEYGAPDDVKHRAIRDMLWQADTAALTEAAKIFTNSEVTSARLTKFNQVESEVLYPPVLNAEQFHCDSYSDEVICVCRLEHHKRQHLLIEAMQHVTTSVKLRLYGTSSGPDYPAKLNALISQLQLSDRVTVDNRWITDEEKVTYFANCLATAYIPVDEDSYGYPSIESSHSSKPILTTTDSGGVLELVNDGLNGYVANPDARSLAQALDQLFSNREKTMQMGRAAHAQLDALNISWKHVLERLLA